MRSLLLKAAGVTTHKPTADWIPHMLN